MSEERFYRLRDLVINDLNSAEQLIGEDPSVLHAKNSIGETVLHFLAVENMLDEVAWLFSKGSKIDTVNDFGNTPLSEAAGLGYLELSKYLLENGADPRVRPPNGDSPLGEAAKQNEPELVELLLTYIAPEAKLRDHFCSVSYEYLFDKESISAQLIYNRGYEW